MAMGETLGLRLSQLVGADKNQGVSFGTEDRSGVKVPLVEIVLKNAKLVEIPVNRINKKGEPVYELKTGDEAVRVYPGRQVVQVVDNKGTVLSEQPYSNR